MGLVPVNVNYNRDAYRGGLTLKVEFFVPQEDELAMSQANQLMKGVYPVAQTVELPPEQPLKWLDRRINEVTKIEATK